MSDILNKWRIYCETDAIYEYIWVSDDDPNPTTCPTNTSHTITSSLTRIVETREPSVVTISQESTKTGSHYEWVSIQFDAIANTTTTYTFSYPYAINILSAMVQTGVENKGDTLSWYMTKDSVIGTITSDVAAEDTVINVSSTVTDTIHVGFMVNLYDGVNTDICGRVVLTDADAGTITVSIASTQIFLAVTPTYVRMTVPFLDKVEMGHPSRWQIGDSKINSSYVPADTIATCEYTNNHETQDKRATMYMEILY